MKKNKLKLIEEKLSIICGILILVWILVMIIESVLVNILGRDTTATVSYARHNPVKGTTHCVHFYYYWENKRYDSSIQSHFVKKGRKFKIAVVPFCPYVYKVYDIPEDTIKKSRYQQILENWREDWKDE